MASKASIRPISDAMGAEIVDLDPTRALDASTRHLLESALDEYRLLLIRNVALDAETHVELVSLFGRPLIENHLGRAYQFVSNIHEEGILGDERFAFHSDHAFMPDPIDVISLFALEVPKGGSQTRFVDGVRAARELPASLRERIAQRSARHIIDPAAPSDAIALEGPPRSSDLPHTFHPIIWKHPRTGDGILYVSEQQTDHVEGLDPDAGHELLRELFAHVYAPRFGYVHEWQQNDLLIWDNRALQHARAAIAPGTRRTLRRVSIGGTPVAEFFRPYGQWGLD